MIKLAPVLLFALLVVACGGGGSAATRSDLPQATAFHLNAAHTGATTFSTDPRFPAAPTWQLTLDGQVSYPLIAAGKVFVTVAGNGSGGPGSRLLALDAASGRTAWGPVAIEGTGYRSGHTYDNGTLFAISRSGVLQAFNAKTGAPGWRVQLPANYVVSAAPTAIDGVVYVTASGNNGAVFAFDGNNGSSFWTRTLADPAAGEHSSPAVSSDGVFVSCDCLDMKLNRADGTEVWHYHFVTGFGGRTSVYSDGLVYTRRDTHPPGMIRRSSDGQHLDSFLGDREFVAATIPAVTPTAAFLLRRGSLDRLDPRMQVVGWSFVGDGQLVSAPLVINRVVVVGSRSGKVYAVNADTGAQVWVGMAGGAIEAADETSIAKPLVGMAAGAGYLVVPAGNSLTAWDLTP
jgi:outer membrane protein assembly factor BamB